VARSGGAWSVKGIDQPTRDIARRAANAAGLTIGEWIDRAIQVDAARHGRLPQSPEVPAGDAQPGDGGQGRAGITQETLDLLFARLAESDRRVEESLKPLAFALQDLAERIVEAEREQVRRPALEHEGFSDLHGFPPADPDAGAIEPVPESVAFALGGQDAPDGHGLDATPVLEQRPSEESGPEESGPEESKPEESAPEETASEAARLPETGPTGDIIADPLVEPRPDSPSRSETVVDPAAGAGTDVGDGDPAPDAVPPRGDAADPATGWTSRLNPVPGARPWSDRPRIRARPIPVPPDADFLLDPAGLPADPRPAEQADDAVIPDRPVPEPPRADLPETDLPETDLPKTGFPEVDRAPPAAEGAEPGPAMSDRGLEEDLPALFRDMQARRAGRGADHTIPPPPVARRMGGARLLALSLLGLAALAAGGLGALLLTSGQPIERPADVIAALEDRAETWIGQVLDEEPAPASDPVPETEPAAPEQAAPAQAAPEQATSEQATSEQATSEQATSEQARPERSSPDLAAPEPVAPDRPAESGTGFVEPETAGQPAAQPSEGTREAAPSERASTEPAGRIAEAPDIPARDPVEAAPAEPAPAEPAPAEPAPAETAPVDPVGTEASTTREPDRPATGSPIADAPVAEAPDPETAVPESAVPESAVPESAVLDPAVPETAASETATPETQVAVTPPAPPVTAPAREVPTGDAELVGLRSRAAAGDPRAQHDLAIRLSGEDGDLAEAARLFREAAIQGLANAQYNLAVLYERGLGVRADETRALLWYHSAAEQGHPLAQYNLGNMYASGRGVPLSYLEAANWFRRAAEQGVPAAAYNLGVLKDAGLGVEQDRADALRWFEMAASLGHQRAQGRLDGKVESATAPGPAAGAGRGVDLDRPRDTTPESSLGAREISAIQAELRRLGYYEGPVDGIVGPMTRSAIRRFQAQNDLPVTGLPSAGLRNELQKQ